MNDGDDVDRKLARKAAVLGWFIGPLAYAGLLLHFPDYWAIAMGTAFVIGSGLFTTKMLFSFENPWTTVGLAPVFGIGWLILLWLMFKVIG